MKEEENRKSVFLPTDLNEAIMAAKSTRNALVVNPNTGGMSFGRIPINNSGIAEGEIYLKLGFIGFGREREGAFGARHVWEKHKKDLNIAIPEDTAQTIADILQVGIDIVVNFEVKKHAIRPVLLNTARGRVVVEEKTMEGIPSYTIISAYGNKDAPGTLIGNLEAPSV